MYNSWNFGSDDGISVVLWWAGKGGLNSADLRALDYSTAVIEYLFWETILR